MMNAMNATTSENFTPEQVHAIVEELRTADYSKVGDTFFLSRVNRLAAAGWVLGTLAYRHKVYKGRKGYPLRHPKNEWRNIAYFFHVPTKVRVFYWDNDGMSKRHANDLALRQPAPKLPHGQHFVTYNKSTTTKLVHPDASPVGTHTGHRVPNRGTCEKCGTETNWIVDVCGRPSYWCGCGN